MHPFTLQSGASFFKQQTTVCPRIYVSVYITSFSFHFFLNKMKIAREMFFISFELIRALFRIIQLYMHGQSHLIIIKAKLFTRHKLCRFLSFIYFLCFSVFIRQLLIFIFYDQDCQEYLACVQRLFPFHNFFSRRTSWQGLTLFLNLAKTFQ